MKDIIEPSPAAIVCAGVDLVAAECTIRAALDEVKFFGRLSLDSARRVGQTLARVQPQLKAEHAWIKWLERIGLKPRSAQNYLIIYQRWAECEPVSHLGLGGVLEFLRGNGTTEEEESETAASTTEKNKDSGAPLVAMPSTMLAAPREEAARVPMPDGESEEAKVPPCAEVARRRKTAVNEDFPLRDAVSALTKHVDGALAKLRGEPRRAWDDLWAAYPYLIRDLLNCSADFKDFAENVARMTNTDPDRGMTPC
ncbi:MAG: hypothetical protein ACYC3I_26395 [Gemmataceae bacterium]